MTVKAGSQDPKAEVTGSDDGEVSGTPQTVSYDTYQKVLDQRKADRAKARELQTALDSANADKAAAEEQRMANDKKFEDLYNKEKAERTKLQDTLQQMTTRQIETAKRDAVRAALGGVRKDDYMKFFDLSGVQLNDDGTADAESVKAAANKFRETYPELVTGKPGARMPQDAGSPIAKVPPKKLEEMSVAELQLALRTAK